MEKWENKDCCLYLGDSISQGFNSINPSRAYASQSARMLNIDVLCQAMTGYTFNKESLKGLEKLSFTPKFITVAYGTNDWEFAISKSQVHTNIREYFYELNKLYDSILVFVITPFWRVHEIHDSVVGSLNDLRKYITCEAGKYSNTHVIQGNEINSHDQRYFQDGILHPNDESFDIISEKVTAIIRAKTAKIVWDVWKYSGLDYQRIINQFV